VNNEITKEENGNDIVKEEELPLNSDLNIQPNKELDK